ncbi:MAG: hypothetical protein WC335_09160 [Candidatus Omnitrophota bacterium]
MFKQRYLSSLARLFRADSSDSRWYIRKMIAESGMSERYIRHIIGEPGSTCIVYRETEEPAGFCILRKSAWDTACFGTGAGGIEYLIAGGNSESDKKKIKKKLLEAALQLSREKKIFFLNSKVESADIVSAHVLADSGFKLMDTIVTYAFLKKSRPRIVSLKGIFKVRNFQKSDLPCMSVLAAGSFSKDRFHADPRLRSRAGELFGKWLSGSFLSGTNITLYTACKGGRAAGFLLYRLDEFWVKECGFRIIGRGLSAVSPEAKGAYIGLVNRVVRDVLERYDAAEFETQLTNLEVLRIWHKFGFEFTRARHTFHKWLI